jgi:Protein of unknown function (DUF4054)
LGPLVVFNPVYWVATYPEFAGIVSTTAPVYFQRAGLYLDLNSTRFIRDLNIMSVLAHMVAAHLAELFDASSARGGTQAVGRISGGEGSVKVNLDMGKTSSSKEAWFRQTKYGAEFWEASGPYRGMRYLVRQPEVIVNRRGW